MAEIRQYSDGGTIPSSDSSLFEFMSRAGLLSDTKAISFCGVIIHEGAVHCFLPKSFRGSETLLKSAKLLFSTLRQYSLKRKTLNSFSATDDGELKGIPPDVAIEVLDDYLRLGLYRNSATEIKRRQTGKIAWPVVIKRLVPDIRDDNTPVYSELLTAKINYSSASEITKIHAGIIAKLDPLFSVFLHNGSHGTAPELRRAQLPYTPEKCIQLLRKELARVYSDREIRLLKHLIILLDTPRFDINESKIVTGITKFEHVWEHMCATLLKNQKVEFASQILTPAYYAKDVLIREAPENRARMDIVISQGTSIAVLDAKYYNTLLRYPPWEDIIKQFYYAQTLTLAHPEKEILNFFIFPDAHQEDGPDAVAVLNSKKEIVDKPFGRIKIVYLNMEKVMADYSAGLTPVHYRQKIFAQQPASLDVS